MRVPSPAASTMARHGTVSLPALTATLIPRCRLSILRRWRNVGRIPCPQRRERRMRQRALQIAPYARHMTQVLRLAVAGVEPRKYSQDLAGALGCERDVELDEFGAVEIRIGEEAGAHVTAQQRKLGRFRDIH